MRSVTSSKIHALFGAKRFLHSALYAVFGVVFLSLISIAPAVAAPPIEGTGCILDQPNNNGVNCNSNDITLSSPIVTVLDACDFPGDFAQLQVLVDVTNNATQRYDIGVWLSVDGDPNGDGSASGICSVLTLDPLTLDTNGNPLDKDGDACGDVESTNNAVDVEQTDLGTVSLLCLDSDGDGLINVPVITSWKQKDDNDCPISSQAWPGTSPKCTDNRDLTIPVPVPGRITVDKVTVPADATDFQFNLSGPATTGGDFDGSEDFQLNDASPVFDTADLNGGVLEGVYVLTEAANANYVTTISCTGDSGAENPAAIDLQAGETVDCVVTNTLNQATITVVKNSLGGDGPFAIEAVGPIGPGAVTYNYNMTTVAGTDTVVMNVTPTGIFEVSETIPANWDLVDASCTNDNGGATVGAWDSVDTIENVSLSAGDAITCTFTNALQGALTLVKNSIGGDGSFDFVTDISGSENINIMTTNGTGAVSTTGVPAGTYSIVETVPAGWNLDSFTCSDGSPPDALVLSDGESVTCTATNIKLGSVTVEKQTLPDGSGQSFAFTGDINGSISDGGQITISNLLPATYTSTETALAGWDLTSIVCNDNNSTGDINTRTATFNLDAGEDIICTFTNTQDGSIEVVKSLAATGPANELFGFTSNFNGAFNLQGDAATTGAIAVTPGSGYTVTEDDPTANGWSNVSSTCNDGSVPGVDITVSPGEAVVCTITNTPLGSATIIKTSVGGDDTFDFTGDLPFNGLQLTTVGGTASQDFTYQLGEGTYDITEEPIPAGWALTDLGCLETGDQDSSWTIPSATLDVELGETVTCTFTNTADATLIIRKETVPDASADGFTFTGSAAGVLHDYSDTAEELTVSGQPGTYTSAETVPAGWVVTNISCANPGSSVVSIGGTGAFVDGDTDVSVDLVAGETVICTFENTQEGSITIEKTSVGDVGLFNFNGSNGLGAFALDTNGSNPDSTAFNNLLPGSYMVSEIVPPNWILSGISCQGQTGSGITIGGAGGFDPGDLGVTIDLVAGENITCSFTNTKLANLELVKSVTNDHGGTAVASDWTLNAAGPTPLSGAGGVSATFVGLGNYTLSESVGPAGYTASSWSCPGFVLNGSVITLAAGDVAVCTIINDDDAASLALVKNVTNDNGGTAVATDWTLNAAGPTPIGGAGGVTATDVSAGVYTLSESAGPDGYTAGTWSCTAGSLQGASLTLALGETAVCSITNNDDAASLALVKNVTNNNGGTAVATDWTLNAAGPTPIGGAGGVAATPVSAGVYTLSESAGPAGYTAGSWSCTAGSLQGASLTLALGETAVCSITNDDNTAMLALVKTVDNGDGGSAVATDWTLSAAGPTPISGAGGVVSTPVNAGVYTLAESAGPSGYTAGAWSCSAGSLQGESLTLALGESATCTIINDDIAPGLTLIKTVVNDNGGTANNTDWILSAAGPTPLSGAGGVAATDVEAGTYVLSESAGPAGYTAGAWVCVGGTQTGSSIELSEGESAVCTIINDDDTATLSLVKNVTNDNQGAAVATDWTLAAAGPTPLSGAGGVAATDVDAGVYTLSESVGPDGYTAGDWSCTAGSLAGNSLTLGNGESAVCTIVNDDDPAMLNLAKTVNGPAVKEANDTYTVLYTIVATNTGGPGIYDLIDAFSPGSGITLNTATATYVGGSENDQNGTLGAYPNFVTNERLAPGLNESWTVTANFTVDPAQTDPVSSQCDPANPVINTGFYNAISGSSTDSDPSDNDTCTGLDGASLTLVKVVNGTGTAVPNDFELTLTGADGTHDSGATYFNGATPNVQVGVAYEVTEVEDQVADYFLEDITCTDDNSQAIVAQPFTLTAAQAVTCTVTNTVNEVVFDIIAGVCVNNAPYVDYDVTTSSNVANDVDITWIKNDGSDEVVQQLVDQPLAGEVLWPGAAIVNGVPVAWPGWSCDAQGENCVQIQDGLVPTMKLTFEINPSATVVVNYPPATPGCTAAPPGTPPEYIAVPVDNKIALILLTLMLLGTGWYMRPAASRKPE